jgi:hypothetical protein
MPDLQPKSALESASALRPPAAERARSVEGNGVASGDADALRPACLNCGVALVGPFCAECGQRDVPPYPSLRELVVDAFWELSGWDGRFASTVRTLFTRPGMLTREFLEGRRARYISPLRLYLMCSLVFFVLAVAAPRTRLDAGKGFGEFTVKTTPTPRADSSRPERVLNAASESIRGTQTLTEEQKAATLEQITHAPKAMQPLLKRAVEDPNGLRRSVVETMPRMLFALLPVFAGIVALFYHGKKYPEHLYFAIHLHAFTFLALVLIELAKFTRVTGIVAIASLIAFVAIPVYATMAFRRAYGGSLVMTLVKEAAISAIYAVTTLVGFVVLIYWVSVMG